MTTTNEKGRMDGRFDGRAGLYDPDRDSGQAYLDAYGLAHAEAAAVRERANARLHFSAGFGAAQAGEPYEAALRRLGLDQYRQGPEGWSEADEAEFQAGLAANEEVDRIVGEWAKPFEDALDQAIANDLNDEDRAPDENPAQDRIRLFRQRILGGMTLEQAKAADVADEKGRWGSGVYGCGYGDDWSETLEEVFNRVLGDGWWEQTCAEAEARN